MVMFPFRCQRARLSFPARVVELWSREEFNLFSRYQNRRPAAPAAAVDANF